MEKICTKCGKLKELEEFVKNKKSKDRHEGVCKIYKKIYRSENKEKIAKHNKAYQSENKEKIAKQTKTYQFKNVKILSDSYIKRAIRKAYNIPRQDITPEMIEAKRQMILTHRLIKEARSELGSARN